MPRLQHVQVRVGHDFMAEQDSNLTQLDVQAIYNRRVLTN
jgi:hypothetical protein